MPAPRDCAGLEWVCIDDRRVHVSDFAHLGSAHRPAVWCPECRDRVFLVLGKIRRHHARHRKGVECVATQPETALHLNTKYYLADALRRAIGTGATLRIRRRCAVGNRPNIIGGEASWLESRSDSCHESDDSVLVAAWDEVRLESRIADQLGHRIPDIVLLENGKSVGAIEVLVSHAVDQGKAEMFKRLEVPWVEVKATDSICDRSTGWTIDQPLDPHACSTPFDWRCGAHQVAESVEPTRPAAVADRPPNRSTLNSGRIVDFYLANGASHRMVYRVRGAYAAGVLVRLALDRNSQLIQHYGAIRGESEAAFLSRINRLIQRDCDADIARLSRKADVVDASRWLKHDSLGLLDVTRIRRRYRFDRVNRKWECDPTDAKQAAIQRLESAVLRRRSEAQRSLVAPKD
jgi:hypothetical protein